MQKALDYHYACNRHHQEHSEDGGIKGMTLVDVCDMLAAFQSATMNIFNYNTKEVNYGEKILP